MAKFGYSLVVYRRAPYRALAGAQFVGSFMIGRFAANEIEIKKLSYEIDRRLEDCLIYKLLFMESGREGRAFGLCTVHCD